MSQCLNSRGEWVGGEKREKEGQGIPTVPH